MRFNRYMALGILTLGGAVAAYTPSAQRATLTVSKAMISQGESVVVTWATPRVDSVYIAGLGVRGAAGRERVVPQSSLRFVLFALTPTGLQTAADSVLVRSTAKGGDAMPDTFSQPRRYRIRARSFAALLARIDDTLQHGLGYPAPLTSLNYPILTTQYVRRSDLVVRGEPVAMRWVAYRVSVAPSTAVSGYFECFIETSVQYQLRAERRRRTQVDGPLIVQQADHLGRLLGG